MHGVAGRRSTRASGGTVRWARPPTISKRRKGGCRVVGRKIRALQALVPNGGSISGLDRLFREAANYIVCLQAQVRLMQMVLGESPSSAHGEGSDQDRSD